jgi:hypothetical protein
LIDISLPEKAHKNPAGRHRNAHCTNVTLRKENMSKYSALNAAAHDSLPLPTMS